MSGPVGDRITRQQFLRITAVAGVSLALGGGLARALVRRAGLHRIRETRTQIGTLVTITVVHPRAEAARRMVDDAFAEMERLESLLSRHREGTAIARLNRDGAIHDAAPEVVEVVEAALGYSVLTHGAFDITVAPVLNLYRASFATTGEPPAEAQLDKARALVGYRDVGVDGRSIGFGKRGMSVTLDGIAKGYVVDRTVARLEEDGAVRVLVAASGDMRSVFDAPRGEGWEVGIQHPREQARLLGVLRLHGESVGTSGDYLEYFTPDKRFHHILDPRTGRSPDHTSAVTVVARRAVDADALATGVFVLGPREGLRLLDQLEGVEGLIVTKDQQVLRSAGLSRYGA